MDGAEECTPYALLLPCRGQGHVFSSMLLARSLASLGFKVTFIYFSSYYAELKALNRLVLPYYPLSHTAEPHDSSSTQDSTTNMPSINAVSDGSFYNGRGADASSHDASLPMLTTVSNGSHGNDLIDVRVVEDGYAPGDIHQPCVATPTMEDSLFNLILELQEQGTPPTCIVSDTLLPLTAHVARRAGIPHIHFWTSNAMSYVHLTNTPALYSQGIFPEKGSPSKWIPETPLMLDHIPGLPPFSSVLCSPGLRFLDPSHPVIPLFNDIASCVKNGERMLIHTMSDIEPDAFRALQMAEIRAYGVGPLYHYTEKPLAGTPLASQSNTNPGTSKHNGHSDCISWLNKQADSSVIYVAFGSFASLSVEEMQELGFGLEASGTPFLWVIREDSHDGPQLLHELLPSGFLERTSKIGMIVGWAPQVEVLAHKAVGGFLTHCGWNSAFESLWEGVPMLCCPRFHEQRLNTHYVSNVWGVGLELGRTDTGGLERRYVEVGVRALMQEEEGFKMKGKAEEIKQLARKTCQPGGQSHSNLQKFYDDMKAFHSKATSHTASRQE